MRETVPGKLKLPLKSTILSLRETVPSELHTFFCKNRKYFWGSWFLENQRFKESVQKLRIKVDLRQNAHLTCNNIISIACEMHIIANLQKNSWILQWIILGVWKLSLSMFLKIFGIYTQIHTTSPPPIPPHRHRHTHTHTHTQTQTHRHANTHTPNWVVV